MSNDGRIFITITDSPVGNSGNGGVGGGRGLSRESRDYISAANRDVRNRLREIDLLRHQVNDFALSEAKQAASYMINNIGNFTGDYNAQRSIQHTMQAGSKVLNIGMAFAVGGIGVGVMATIGAIASYGMQEYANQFAITKQNYTINKLRDISGLDNLTNGSR